MKMVRTQIQLPADMHRDLKRWAQRLGISLSEAIRRSVSDRLAVERLSIDQDQLVREALVVVGKYSDTRGPPGGDRGEPRSEAHER